MSQVEGLDAPAIMRIGAARLTAGLDRMPRLALGGVDDHDGGAVAVLRGLDHCRQLAREGKRRTALAPQVDLFGHVDQFFDGKPGQWAEDLAMGVQVEPRHPV